MAERSKGAAETMKVELQVRIAQLEHQLEEEGVREGVIGGLQEQVQMLEEQLARNQAKVGTNWSTIFETFMADYHPPSHSSLPSCHPTPPPPPSSVAGDLRG